MQRLKHGFNAVCNFSAGLVGTASDLINTGVFGFIAANILKEELFPVFGGLAMAGSVLNIHQNWGKKPTVQLLAESITPGSLIGAAVFLATGPEQALLFTVALGVHSAIILVDGVSKTPCCKKTKDGETATQSDGWDTVFLAVQAGKTAGMLATITIGGVGNVMTLIKTGCAITTGQYGAAIGTAVVSGLSMFWNGLRTAKTAKKDCCPDKQRPALLDVDEALSPLASTDPSADISLAQMPTSAGTGHKKKLSTEQLQALKRRLLTDDDDDLEAGQGQRSPARSPL